MNLLLKEEFKDLDRFADYIKNWEKDPCWDLDAPDDMNPTLHELKRLKEYQERAEKIWEKEYRDRIAADADSLGLSIDKYVEYRNLLVSSKRKLDDAKRTLIFYMSNEVKNFGHDNRVEVDGIIDNIYDAVMDRVKSDLILEKEKIG